MNKILAALAVATLASPAFAQAVDFATADADQSGDLSQEELAKLGG